jgi:ATP-dependent RNA helicase DeaD
MTSDSTEDTTTFADLGLRPELLGALSGLGYEEPTPIQREAIPPLLQGRDLLGQAATGTGKTAAFALPVLERIGRQAERGEPMALVLVPTRELAMQVSEAMHRYGRELGARILPIYGGQPIGRQLRALERGVDVVVATPGRAIDHITRQTLGLGSLQVVVLDEADEMLDMGFAEDIEAILRHTPQDRQTVLFSATMPPRINAMVRRHLHDPVRIRLGDAASGPGDGSLVRQRAYVVPRAHKAAALGRVLDVEAPTAALVFCRTRDQVEELAETLNGRGYRAEALHGGMDQAQRDRVMGRLRRGIVDLWWPPTSPPAAWMSSSSPTWSITTSPVPPTPMCTASAGLAGPAARVSPSPWPSHENTGCSRPSSGQPTNQSLSSSCPPSPTYGPGGWS